MDPAVPRKATQDNRGPVKMGKMEVQGRKESPVNRELEMEWKYAFSFHQSSRRVFGSHG